VDGCKPLVDDYIAHGGRGPAHTSQVKGVSWHKNNHKWKADSKGQYLGYHATEEEAAKAIDDYVKSRRAVQVDPGLSALGFSV
jgi:hypothetical protein